MRELVMDTETTGLDPHNGDRVVEIGCVEVVNLVQTGRTYHQYINPERSMPEEAFAVHGLGDDFLADKPVFAEIAEQFLSFVGDARLVIHNAAFDMSFLNAEFRRLGLPEFPASRALDTLDMARRRYPGAQATLDALCRRYGVENTNRVLHGALLDAQLLAEVYLELSGGRQPALSLNGTVTTETGVTAYRKPEMRPPRPHAPTPEEIRAHEELVARLKDPLWLA